nr:MAG TPA: hypothetical protein [Caudoviricetes sp.]
MINRTRSVLVSIVNHRTNTSFIRLLARIQHRIAAHNA